MTTTERLCAGVLHRETEFALVPGVGRVFGACGPCALAAAASNVTGAVVHTADTYGVMAHAGLCGPSGASTIAGLKSAAQLLGLPAPAAYQPYGEPWPQWQAFLDAHAGYDPIVIEVANGQAFVDAISGLGENATNLQYHFVCVLGFHPGGFSAHAQRTLPAGYWVADGDNYAGGNDNAHGFNAANVLQFYPVSVMSAARVCAALALPGPAQGVPLTMAWTQQSDGSGKDAHGHTCGGGVMGYLTQSGLASSDGLLSETFYDGNDSFLPLSNGRVVTAHHNGTAWTTDEQGAQALVSIWQALTTERADDAAKAQEVSALNTRLGDAQATITQLKAQIAQLEQSQSDPQAAAAKALMAQLKATLAQF